MKKIELNFMTISWISWSQKCVVKRSLYHKNKFCSIVKKIMKIKWIKQNSIIKFLKQLILFCSNILDLRFLIFLIITKDGNLGNKQIILSSLGQVNQTWILIKSKKCNRRQRWKDYRTKIKNLKILMLLYKLLRQKDSSISSIFLLNITSIC